MSFEIEVFDGGYTVACGFCGKHMYQAGRFVLGLELPRSVERVLGWHYKPSMVFGNSGVCENTAAWAAGKWSVVKSRGEIAAGQYDITEDGPVVDPAIDGGDMGRTWIRNRVEKIAKAVIDASPFRNREWHVNRGDHPNIIIKTNDGQAAIVPISRDEIDVNRMTDDDIEGIVYRHLRQMEMDGL